MEDHGLSDVIAYAPLDVLIAGIMKRRDVDVSRGTTRGGRMRISIMPKPTSPERGRRTKGTPIDVSSVMDW